MFSGVQWLVSNPGPLMFAESRETLRCPPHKASMRFLQLSMGEQVDSKGASRIF
jgi:hypothetical protein